MKNTERNRLTQWHCSIKSFFLSKKKVKYLGFWLDKKLNFKKHCQIRVTNAKKTLYAMISLLNFKWELASNAIGQFHFTCIVPIADNDSEIWFQFNDQKQKHYLKMFDQLQNIVMKKILEVFKTTLIEMMKIECNLMPSNLQFLKNAKIRRQNCKNKTLK